LNTTYICIQTIKNISIQLQVVMLATYKLLKHSSSTLLP